MARIVAPSKKTVAGRRRSNDRSIDLEQLDRVERVTTELEEVGIDARRSVVAEYVLPHLRDQRAFEVVGRLDARAAPRHRGRRIGRARAGRRGSMRSSLPVAPRGISSTDDHAARHLERRELLADERRGAARAVTVAPVGSTTAAPTSSPSRGWGTANATAWTHVRVREQRLVDLAGRDLLAAAVDDLLQPAGDRQVAVVVEAALVAGAEPPVEEGGGVGVGIVEISAT